MLDYDEKSASTRTTQADEILRYIKDEDLTVEMILDTHPHADHFSAAGYLKHQTGAPTGIGAHITRIQSLWKEIYNWTELATDGRQWDRLFKDRETFQLGETPCAAIHSPGHTLASVTYIIGDAAFVHDTLFMPDSGTARADFPGGCSKGLWHSIQAILALPPHTRIFTGHDYRPDGRPARWQSTIAEQRAYNAHIPDQTEATFVKMRDARDAQLPMPRLILHALQINIAGGHLPQPDENGRRFLQIPLNALGQPIW